MKTCLIILGYVLNKDNTLHPTLIKRLNMARRVIETEKIDRIVVSGGIPYPDVNNISEADAMYDYLVSHGISNDLLVKEDRSVSTRENAKYSIPLARQCGAEKIIVLTTVDHFYSPYYNVVEIFANELKDDHILLAFYTNDIPLTTKD